MDALTVSQRRAHMELFWKGSRVYKLDDLMSERPINPFLHLIEVLYIPLIVDLWNCNCFNHCVYKPTL